MQNKRLASSTWLVERNFNSPYPFPLQPRDKPETDQHGKFTPELWIKDTYMNNAELQNNLTWLQSEILSVWLLNVLLLSPLETEEIFQ